METDLVDPWVVQLLEEFPVLGPTSGPTSRAGRRQSFFPPSMPMKIESISSMLSIPFSQRPKG